MMEKDNKKVPQISIEISKELERGIYSNVASIIHSQDEFIFDFGILMPNRSTIVVQSRIITNPSHAKKFVLALQDNINKYEMKFGTIKTEDSFSEVQTTQTLDKIH